MNLTKQILRLLSLFLIILMITNGIEPCKGPGSPCGSSSDCCGYCRKVGRNPQKKCGSFRGRKWKIKKTFKRCLWFLILKKYFNLCSTNQKSTWSFQPLQSLKKKYLLACLNRFMRKLLSASIVQNKQLSLSTLHIYLLDFATHACLNANLNVSSSVRVTINATIPESIL